MVTLDRAVCAESTCLLPKGMPGSRSVAKARRSRVIDGTVGRSSHQPMHVHSRERTQQFRRELINALITTPTRLLGLRRSLKTTSKGVSDLSRAFLSDPLETWMEIPSIVAIVKVLMLRAAFIVSCFVRSAGPMPKRPCPSCGTTAPFPDGNIEEVPSGLLPL